MSAHRAAVATVVDTPHFLQRSKCPDTGLVLTDHGIAGAVIRTHRTWRTSPAGWVYRVRFGDWESVGYERTQRDALYAAAVALCAAVDSGELSDVA